jgi:hypothetical protein
MREYWGKRWWLPFLLFPVGGGMIFLGYKTWPKS